MIRIGLTHHDLKSNSSIVTENPARGAHCSYGPVTQYRFQFTDILSMNSSTTDFNEYYSKDPIYGIHEVVKISLKNTKISSNTK